MVICGEPECQYHDILITSMPTGKEMFWLSHTESQELSYTVHLSPRLDYILDILDLIQIPDMISH